MLESAGEMKAKGRLIFRGGVQNTSKIGKIYFGTGLSENSMKQLKSCRLDNAEKHTL